MNKKRLLQLADFLDTLPPENFDFSDWGRQTDCGSVGCALGWACTLPFAKKENVWLKAPQPGYRSFHFMIGDSGFDSYEIAEKLFDVTQEQHDKLFMFTSFYDSSNRYSGLPKNATAKQVATHIREYVRDAA